MGRWRRFRYHAGEFWETVGFSVLATVYFLVSVGLCITLALLLM